MKDIIVLLSILLGMYVVMRLILKEPILPWSEKKKNTPPRSGKGNKNKKKKNKKNIPDQVSLDEEEAAPFQELFPNVVGIESHMLRHEGNEFTMFAEVEPVNYFLRDPEEQEIIDVAFETWLAMINYPVRIYIQNRFIDLTEPIEDIQRNMKDGYDLNYLAKEYGENMIRNLQNWQQAQPRYETKSYILFDYKVDVKEIKADSDEEKEEKIIDKAFNELYRRVQAARQQLRSGEMNVVMLSGDGIVEVLYHTFNRRKALTNRYKDIERAEQLALYVTADQTPSHIAKVKGEIEEYVQEVASGE